MMNADLAFDLLGHGTRLLEETHESTGRVNLFAARALGDASLLLGFATGAQRCERFLREASPQSFWQGVVTNIRYNRDSVSDAARSLTPIEKIKQNHPRFTANYASSVMTKGMGAHIGPCQARDYDTAYANAGSNEFIWHEVVVAQAVNGDMPLAAPKLHEIKNTTLREHVQLVFAIESYRRGDTIAGRKMHEQLQSNGIGEHAACHLALGVTDHVPWLGYPFADY